MNSSDPFTPGSIRSIIAALIAFLLCCSAVPCLAQSSEAQEERLTPEAMFGFTPPSADLPEDVAATAWAVLSDQLVVALRSSDYMQQQAALCMIIKYGDSLSLKAGVKDIGTIYLKHPDDDLRRMAVIALGKIDTRWTNDLLKRAVETERVAKVRHTIASVLVEKRNNE